jgi:hypothetical protein
MPELPTAVHFEGRTPILRVQDLNASIGYYIRALGFRLDWKETWFASVSRDGCNVFLSEGDQGNPGTWVWFGVSDAQALFRELQSTGARIRHAPANFRWALEMQVEDLDGNVLRMGSEPLEDQPVGEWLDMRGARWVFSSENGWTKT